MSETSFILPYIIGSTIAIVGLVIRLRSSRTRYAEAMPGRIFKVVQDLKILRSGTLDESEYLAMRSVLSHASQDIVGAVKSESDEPMTVKLTKEARTLLQNVSLCLKTFVFLVRNDLKQDEMDFSGLDSAINDLVRTVNRYVFKCGYEGEHRSDRTVPVDIRRRIIDCKWRLYLSLFGGETVDVNLTKKFLEDFRSFGSENLTVATYLDKLEKEWIYSKNLHGISDVFLVPLITTWNILQHCDRETEADEITQTLEPVRNIKTILREGDSRFWEISFMGLNYDKREVVRNIELVSVLAASRGLLNKKRVANISAKVAADEN